MTNNENNNEGSWKPKARSAEPLTAYEKSVKSDFGTVLLHLIASIACIISLLTGLRITADEQDAVFAKWLSPILPQGEIWSWHFYSGLAVFFAATGYIIYLNRSGLARRTSLSRVKSITMSDVASKIRLAGINVALHWLLYVCFCVLTVTGVLMYIGYAGIIVPIHLIAAYVVLAYFFAHIIMHFLYGGWWQLLRVINPAPLQKTSQTKSKPILASLALGTLVAGFLYTLDGVTTDEITIKEVATAPKIDGDITKDVYKGAQTAMIRTMQGSNLGVEGTRGSSKVWMKGVRHQDTVYFAFKWEDPTRSVMRVPMIKKADGWHLMANHPDNGDEYHFYEDKFAILFSKSDAFGSGGTTSYGPKPLAGAISAPNDRGLHYTRDGSMADMWQWKASRGGLIGKVDDMHFGPPKPVTQAQMEHRARYSGGYDNDPGKTFYLYNFFPESVRGGLKGVIKLRKLPKDYKDVVAKMGKADYTPGKNHVEDGTKWWLYEDEMVDYSKALDDTIPVGTILPSTMIFGKYDPDRGDVDGNAKWKDGYWTLEMSRKVKTTSPFDLPFTGSLFTYVSVFDNSQTRHTRHMRPVKMNFQ